MADTPTKRTTPCTSFRSRHPESSNHWPDPCANCGWSQPEHDRSAPLTPADVQVGDWVRTEAPNGHIAIYAVVTMDAVHINGWIPRSWIKEVRRG